MTIKTRLELQRCQKRCDELSQILINEELKCIHVWHYDTISEQYHTGYYNNSLISWQDNNITSKDEPEIATRLKYIRICTICGKTDVTYNTKPTCYVPDFS